MGEWDGLPNSLEVQETLGSGGFGVVYRVLARDTGEDLALKVPRLGLGRELSLRFLQECEATARLSHPAILKTVDFGLLADGRPYLLSELLRGMDWRSYGELPEQERQRAFSEANFWQQALSVRAALEYAHTQGILHRDIKPDNLFLTPDGQGRVLDFGIAALDEGRRISTETGVLLGTPRYMHPKLFAGEPADPSCDFYAWGLSVFEVLEGPGRIPPEDLKKVLAWHRMAKDRGTTLGLSRYQEKYPELVEALDPGFQAQAQGPKPELKETIVVSEARAPSLAATPLSSPAPKQETSWGTGRVLALVFFFGGAGFLASQREPPSPLPVPSVASSTSQEREDVQPVRVQRDKQERAKLDHWTEVVFQRIQKEGPFPIGGDFEALESMRYMTPGAPFLLSESFQGDVRALYRALDRSLPGWVRGNTPFDPGLRRAVSLAENLYRPLCRLKETDGIAMDPRYPARSKVCLGELYPAVRSMAFHAPEVLGSERVFDNALVYWMTDLPTGDLPPLLSRLVDSLGRFPPGRFLSPRASFHMQRLLTWSLPKQESKMSDEWRQRLAVLEQRAQLGRKQETELLGRLGWDVLYLSVHAQGLVPSGTELDTILPDTLLQERPSNLADHLNGHRWLARDNQKVACLLAQKASGAYFRKLEKVKEWLDLPPCKS